LSDVYLEPNTKPKADADDTAITDAAMIRKRLTAAKNNGRIAGWQQRDARYTRLFRAFAYEDIDSPAPFTTIDEDHGEEETDSAFWAQQAEGTVQHLGTNIRYKSVTICYSHPEFYVEMADILDPMTGEPMYDSGDGDTIDKFFKRLWLVNNWKRVTRKAYLKSAISGMGIICCYWNPERGVVWEPVSPKDFLFDPYLEDFERLRWGARRIKVPLEEAIEMYPALKDMVKEEYSDDGTSTSMCDLWVYWDATTEAILYNWEVVDRTENLYKRVPMAFLTNEEDPETPFDTGDFDSCLGLQAQHTLLVDANNDQARNGGTITAVNSNMLRGKSKENFANGHLQSILDVENGAFEDILTRFPAAPLNPAAEQAIAMMERAMDARTAVTPEERGMPDPNAKFATQVAIANKMQGAMGQDQIAEFERFINILTQWTLEYLKAFMKPETEDEVQLFRMLHGVSNILVTEGTMNYSDPAYQANMVQQAIQIGLAVAPAGVQVDFTTLVKRYLNLLGIKDANRLVQQAPPPPPVTAGQPSPLPSVGATGQGGMNQLPASASPAPA
jgi:hypothetical protein